jgi:hypothetical protein
MPTYEELGRVNVGAGALTRVGVVPCRPAWDARLRPLRLTQRAQRAH